MSLLQALIQDPISPPLAECWIALRTDGVMGSGTQDDPWNGGEISTSQLSISAANVSVSGPDANHFVTVTISNTVHTFVVGDKIIVSGFDSPPAPDNLAGELLNGAFVVQSTAGSPTNTFTYMLFYDDSGTPPHDGPAPPASPTGSAIKCQLDPYLFDRVMRDLVPKTVPITVHLGPGLFKTKGFENRKSYVSDSPSHRVDVSWMPSTGMNIVGAGMGATTLQLVQASGRNRSYQAIGVPQTGYEFALLDNFCAENFTVDCNIAGQPSQSVTCAAIWIRGNHTRYRRIRAINFGRQGVGINSGESFETFVLAAAGPNYDAARPADAQPTDCVMEECVVERPGLNSVKESSCLSMIGASSGLVSSLNVQTYLRACVIRNCVVNCEYQDKPIAIDSITRSTTTATVVTRGPHGLSVNDAVRISGVRVFKQAGQNQFDNEFNGSFTVTWVGPATNQFQYVMAVDPSANPTAGSEMWVGRWPSEFIALDSISVLSGSVLTGFTVAVTTKTAHYLVIGSTAVITGATLTPASAAVLNGKWKVTSVTNSKTFVCLMIMKASPGALVEDSSATLGVVHQALTIPGCTSSLAEGNQIFNCTTGGPYNDTGATKDFVARNNHYRNVYFGPNLNFDATLSFPERPMKCTALTNASGIATFEVTSDANIPHGLSVGQAIAIQGATVGEAATTFNGAYTIASIPSPTSFTYILSGSTGATVDSPVPVKLWPLWETLNCTIENNVIELIPGIFRVQPAAIRLSGALPAIPFNFAANPNLYFIYRQVVIRNNVIRYAAYVPAGKDGDPARDLAIILKSCENGLIENNTIDLVLASGSTISNPMIEVNCKTTNYFNNRSSAGNLIQGAISPAAPLKQELTTVVDDAMSLAVL